MTDHGRIIKPFKKMNSLIAELTIIDADGSPIGRRFQLQEGENEFRCRATYADGFTDWFEPFWTCPLPTKTGGSDDWGVLGTHRRASATIRASRTHEKYWELTCWVDRPSNEQRSIIYASTAFDYSLINRIPDEPSR
jgi:hypothetical protein